MEEETLRKMAVEQYLQGKTAVSIYREMGRSKYWFFKWLRRYQSGDANWYQDRPKIPRSHPRQISPEMRKLIINIRTQLEEHPYAQTGTSAIKWEFQKLGVTPPSDRTINRILKREGLIKKNSLYPQRSGIPLFQKASGDQQHPSGGPPWTKIHQKRWAFLFAQCHGSIQPPGLSSSPTKKRRPSRGPGLDQLLEDYGNTRLSSSRQPSLFPRKQSLPPFLWHRPEGLSVFGDRGGLHPDRRTLA
jgi:transposase-like protein